MKISNKSCFLLLFVLFTILLSGCRVILFSEDSPPILKELGKQKVNLDATAFVRTASILIRAETTFPPGSVFDVELNAYPEEASAFQVELSSVDPLKEDAASSTMTVNEDGEMEGIVIDRPDYNTRYRIRISFDPASQPKEVVDKLGRNGENMEMAAGVEQLENSKTFVYRKYVNVMRRDEPGGFEAELNFKPVREKR
jgi:hypothetical protein